LAPATGGGKERGTRGEGRQTADGANETREEKESERASERARERERERERENSATWKGNVGPEAN